MSINRERKKEAIKAIIRELHQGLSVEEARERLEKEVGEISSTEIADIEQTLINEGMSPEEIKKFCNVHALLFQEALAQDVAQEDNPAHPVYLFKLENREIEKITAALGELIEKAHHESVETVKEKLREQLVKLQDLELHYTRKEQLLFPYLERYGFMGPSKVMWGKDNEIRELYKQGLAGLEKVSTREELKELIDDILGPLVEEVEGMIFKEENILFPTSLEKLSTEDWVEILKESDEVGYAYIERPRETAQLIEELKYAVSEEPVWSGGQISFPTGNLTLKELTHILNALPVEVTFVDAEDTVRYFSDNSERIFVRTRSVIGRKVHNCHPPQSVELVQKILSSFKEGSRDRAEFWLEIEGRMIYIQFFPIIDDKGTYLGTVELTQDITDLKAKEGSKRLLDEEN